MGRQSAVSLSIVSLRLIHDAVCGLVLFSAEQIHISLLPLYMQVSHYFMAKMDLLNDDSFILIPILIYNICSLLG